MKICLSAPSKTFLMGEYLALSGGPSLVINSAPRFELHIDTRGSGRCEGIHPDSPAGQWIRQNSDIFRTQDIRFVDPHGGQGGLGASSSQFLLTHLWSRMAPLDIAQWDRAVKELELWQDYRACAWSGKGFRPSGADVMGQWIGGISFFLANPFYIESMAWPFKNYGFFVVRTGQKLATHEHLQQNSPTDFSLLEQQGGSLVSAVKVGVEAIKQADWNSFAESVRKFKTVLVDKGYITEHSKKLLQQLDVLPEVEVAKGCGAMGADTLLVLFAQANRSSLHQQLQAMGLEVVSSSDDLSHGVEVSVQFAGQTSPSRTLSRPRSGELHV